MTTPTRDVPLGYLRTFLTLLVVAHHAALAYVPGIPPPAGSLSQKPWLWMAFPVVDSVKWPAAPLFTGFNDCFFMSLMFLISGAFAWPSLLRKGAAAFVHDRALKLGVPFCVSAALLSPLSYYPSYLMTGGDPGLGPFVEAWLAVGAWPAGPAWFLWVLLFLGSVVALVQHAAEGFGPWLGRLHERLSGSPRPYVLALVGASSLVYLPMAAVFGPEHWMNYGPFWVQSSRLLHYGLYFLAGIGLGAVGLHRGLLAPDGGLARRWPVWVLTSLLAFVLSIVTFIWIVSAYVEGGAGPAMLLKALGNLMFVISCACSSFAFLSLFLRFARTPHPVLDNLAENAYGIFLLHYVCVSWFQFLLLGNASLVGGIKMVTVFIASTATSWALSAFIRRIPAVARVV